MAFGLQTCFKRNQIQQRKCSQTNPKAIAPWQARPWHTAQHKAAEKEDKFKAKSNSQLQKPRAAGQNKPTTLLAFFRPDVTGMMLAVVTSLTLAVLFRHGSVAVLGDSLQREEIPVSEC